MELTSNRVKCLAQWNNGGFDGARTHDIFVFEVFETNFRWKNQTTNVIVYTELGKMPLSVKIRTVYYWFRITKDLSILIFNLFNMRDVHKTMKNRWSLSTTSLLDWPGFSYIFISSNVLNIDIVSVIQRLKYQLSYLFVCSSYVLFTNVLFAEVASLW